MTHIAGYVKSYAIGIFLNIIYVLVEMFYGFHVGSSALVADAGHNATDVVSMAICWLATWLATLRPFGQYTYGLRKTTILASAINGTLIAGAAIIILLEAFKKIKNPSEIPGGTIMIVAGIGILINTGTALIFMKGQKKDLNIKGTFLHMAADAGVSAGVLVGGLLMSITGNYLIDPVLSFIIVAVILWGAVGLLKDSFKLSVDGVPKGIDILKVKSFLKRSTGALEIHDLHIWAVSTTETALTAHLSVPLDFDNSRINCICEDLQKEFNIQHTTLQAESENDTRI